MKVLMVHNFYGSEAPSGENMVFEAEKAMLSAHGHEVEVFTRNSDEIRKQGIFGTIRGGMAVPMNPWTAAAIWRKVEQFKPDVVHVHNTFPLISPSIFPAIGNSAAQVLTLHNYRLFCPNAVPLRNGMVCTECLDSHSSWPSMKYGCYRGSRLATLPLALSVELHRYLGTWTRQVDAFIALSMFQKKLMVAAGLPEDKVYVKPNFLAGNPTPIPWDKREPCIVYAGRLSREKGVGALITAWRKWGSNAPALRIVGDGSLRAALESNAATLNIRFLGQVPPEEAQAHIAGARLFILPSECFEGFPMTIAEAFASGTPAAVSNIGPLPAIVNDGKNGVLFKPGDPDSLLQAVKAAWETPGLLERLGQGARWCFEESYTEACNYDQLMSIYSRAISRNASLKQSEWGQPLDRRPADAARGDT